MRNHNWQIMRKCVWVAGITSVVLLARSPLWAQPFSVDQEIDYSKFPDRIPGAQIAPIPDPAFIELASLGAGSDALTDRPDDSYLGLTGPEWAAQLSHEAAAVRLQAFDAVQAIYERPGRGETLPPDAARQVVLLVNDAHPSIRFKTLQSAENLGAPLDELARAAIGALDDPYPAIRIAAIDLLASHPEVCPPETVARLVPLLSDTTRSMNWEIDDPFLVQGNRMVREAAITALGEFGPAAEAAKTELLGAAREPNPNVAARSHYGLSKVAGSDPDVINLLISAFDDEAETRSRIAIDCLCNIGPAASAALPTLLELPGDRMQRLSTPLNANSRRLLVPRTRANTDYTLFDAMARIGPDDPRVLEILNGAIESEDVNKSHSAAAASRYLDEAIGLDFWLHALAMEDDVIVGFASEALAAAGQSASPKLNEGLANTSSEHLQIRLIDLISRQGAFADDGELAGDFVPTAVQLLTNMFEDRESGETTSATNGDSILIGALLRTDPEQVTQHAIADVRRHALRTLQTTPGDVRGGLDYVERTLIRALGDDDLEIRVDAAEAIVESFPERMGLVIRVILETRAALAKEYAGLQQAGIAAGDGASREESREDRKLQIERELDALNWLFARILPTLAPYEPLLIEIAFNDAIAACGPTAPGYDRDSQTAFLKYATSAIASMPQSAISPTLTCLQAPDLESRVIAACVAGEIGPQANEAAPWLIELLDEEGSFGDDAMINGVVSANGVALRALTRMGDLGVEVRRAMLRKYIDENDLRALDALLSQGEAAVNLLSDALQNRESSVSERRRIIDALRQFGMQATSAIPHLLEEAASEPYFSHEIAEAILHIDPSNKQALQLQDRNGVPFKESTSYRVLLQQALPTASVDVSGLVNDVVVEGSEDALLYLTKLPRHVVADHVDQDLLRTLFYSLNLALRAPGTILPGKTAEARMTIIALAGPGVQPAFAEFADKSILSRPEIQQLFNLIEPRQSFEILELHGLKPSTMRYLQSFAPDAPQEFIPQVMKQVLREAQVMAEATTNSRAEIASRANAEEAMTAIIAFGSRSAVVKEELISKLGDYSDESLYSLISMAIGNMGREAVAPVTLALIEGEPEVKKHAAEILRDQLSAFVSEAIAIVSAQDLPEENKGELIEILKRNQ